MKTRVEVVVDRRVRVGQIEIGGVRIVQARTDEELGRELRTKQVRLPTEGAAERMREIIRKDPKLELAE